MRMPSYLSPSQLSMWERCREDYYMSHLAEVRPQNPPKTHAMSVGSAFDAYVKAEMYQQLFGSDHNPQFEFTTLFEDQVVSEHRDWALEHGKHAFDSYKISGAFEDLMELVANSKYAPQFEFTVKGDIGSVPLLGKPDLRFVHRGGAHVILDWKVSGYCSNYGTSPAKYYKLVRDGWTQDTCKPSRSDGTSHKGYEPSTYKGIEINKRFLEESNETWASQITIYGWLLGEEVGTENVITCIDQLACKPNRDYPLIRVANHISKVSSEYQINLLERLKTCWTAIENNHIFDDVTKEESIQRCEVLDKRSEMLLTHGDGLKSIQSFVTEQNQIYKF